MDHDMWMKEKSDLLKFRPFPSELYEQYALTSLTAYCVYWLQKWRIAPSLENIAVASHRMFPVKFAMVGWPELPDLTRANRSVLQMRPKYRNLATSSAEKGVFLNARGVEEAEALIARFGVPRIGDTPVGKVSSSAVRAELGKRARSIHPERHLEDIRRSRLFQLYRTSRFDEAEAIDLVGLLNVYDHTPSREKRAKLKQFVDSARELGDEEVIKFLEEVGHRFRRYLNK